MSLCVTQPECLFFLKGDLGEECEASEGLCLGAEDRGDPEEDGRQRQGEAMDSHGDAPGPHKQLMIYMRKSSPLGGAAGHSCAGAAGTQLGDRRVGGLAQRLGQPPLQI